MKNFKNENISFDPVHAANLMLYWTKEGLHILSTDDATVSLGKQFLENILSGNEKIQIEGKNKSVRSSREEYVIELFEGQSCLITGTKAAERKEKTSEQETCD